MTNKLLSIAIIICSLFACKSNNAEPDNEFDVSVNDHKLKNTQPKVLFDQAHRNITT